MDGGGVSVLRHPVHVLAACALSVGGTNIASRASATAPAPTVRRLFTTGGGVYPRGSTFVKPRRNRLSGTAAACRADCVTACGADCDTACRRLSAEQPDQLPVPAGCIAFCHRGARCAALMVAALWAGSLILSAPIERVFEACGADNAGSAPLASGVVRVGPGITRRAGMEIAIGPKPRPERSTSRMIVT
jgi:hypothetical protein